MNVISLQRAYNQSHHQQIIPADTADSRPQPDAIASACAQIFDDMHAISELRINYPNELHYDYTIKINTGDVLDIAGLCLCSINRDTGTLHIAADSLNCTVQQNDLGDFVSGEIEKGTLSLLQARQKLVASNRIVAEEIIFGNQTPDTLNSLQKFKGIRQAVTAQQDYSFIENVIDTVAKSRTAAPTIREAWNKKPFSPEAKNRNLHDIETIGQILWSDGVTRFKAAGLTFSWTVGRAGPDKFMLEEGSFEMFQARCDIVTASRTLAAHHLDNFKAGRHIQSSPYKSEIIAEDAHNHLP